MKRLALLFVLVFCLANVAVGAEPITVKIGTGKETGMYYKSGKMIAQQLQSIKVDVVSTNGSVDNLARLKSGEIDFAFVQLDALLKDTTGEVVLVKRMYPEYVHLITQSKGPSSIKDINKKSGKIAVGSEGTGNWVTWQALRGLEKDYADIAMVPLSGARALSALEAGEVDGVIMVAGIGTGDVMRANQDAGKYRLAKMNDGAFDNAKYKSEKVYEFVDMDSKKYPNLFPGMFNGSVETLKVDAVLVTTNAWIAKNEALYDKVFDGVQRALPGIKQAASGK